MVKTIVAAVRNFETIFFTKLRYKVERDALSRGWESRRHELYKSFWKIFMMSCESRKPSCENGVLCGAKGGHTTMKITQRRDKSCSKNS